MRLTASTLAALILAGCYSPSPELGAPCSPSFECPTGQVCDRGAAGGPRCGGAQDELPPGVTDVSGGGAFPFDARGNADEIAAPCATAPGPEVRFQLSLAASEVVYLATFGSSGNPVIAIYEGGCAELGTSEACADDTCGGVQAQGAWPLAAGSHCIVVDHAGVPDGEGALEVVRSGNAGDPLTGRSGTVTGDTCKDDNTNDADNNDDKVACGDEPAPDHHYFFTLCPAETVMAHIETCGGASWDTVLQFRDGKNTEFGCDDDDDNDVMPTTCRDEDSSLTSSLAGPGLFWAIIDGFNDFMPESCGPYTLKYQF